MALKKVMQYNTGIEGEYHRIIKFENDFSSNFINIVVATYKDKESRDSGKKYIDVSYFMINISDDNYDTYFSLTPLRLKDVNHILQSYKYLKEKIDFFSDASDI